MENSCELTSCGEVSGIYVAAYGISCSASVATAAIVMNNILSNCWKVCTSIDKPIYSVSERSAL